MKILFLTDNFSPEINAPATRTLEHCREWVKSGAEVTVITCVPNFPKGKVYVGYKNKLLQKEVIEGIKVIRVWSFIAENKGFVKRVLDFISFSFTSFIVGLFIKTDIIIATSPQFFTALSGKALCFLKRKPWVMEVRDLWPESIKSVGVMNDNIFIKYFEFLEKRCYKSADKIITVTNSFKNEIIKKGISRNKIFVVKNGANIEMFKPKKKNVKLLDEYGLQEKIVLGYVGTHGMAHKLDFLLDCAKESKNELYHFLFIGDGAEKENLLLKAKNEKIKNVTFIDSVSKEEVSSYLSLIDVSIINLKKDDLFKTVIPSKIFENVAMEIPILLGVDGESRSIIEKYNAGIYYEPENIESFYKNLKKILNPQNYQKIKEDGRQLIVDYDRKILAKKMLNILKS